MNALELNDDESNTSQNPLDAVKAIFGEKHMALNPLSRGSSHCGTVEANVMRNHEVVSLIPGLAQWVKDPVLL